MRRLTLRCQRIVGGRVCGETMKTLDPACGPVCDRHARAPVARRVGLRETRVLWPVIPRGLLTGDPADRELDQFEEAGAWECALP